MDGGDRRKNFIVGCKMDTEFDTDNIRTGVLFYCGDVIEKRGGKW